jgi:hypothetical protein
MNRKTALVTAVLLVVLAAFAIADGAPSAEELFFQAVRRGDTAYVKNALDSQEVGINITNSDGQTPIMVAVDRQLLPMVVLLLTYRPDLEAQDNNSRTVFDIAKDKGNMAISSALERAR